MTTYSNKKHDKALTFKKLQEAILNNQIKFPDHSSLIKELSTYQYGQMCKHIPEAKPDHIWPTMMGITVVRKNNVFGRLHNQFMAYIRAVECRFRNN